MSTNFPESPNPSTLSTALDSTFSSPRSPSNSFRIRNTVSNVNTIVLAFSFVCILLLTACGPETPSVNHSVMRDEAQRIAQEYSAAPDIDKARVELDELDVANINQWFKYVTEEAITKNGDPGSTNALVQLALDLGIQSTTIDRYGVDAGILAPPPSAEVLAPAASVLEQSSASVIDAFKADEDAQPAESQRIELVPVNAADENAEAVAESAAASDDVAAPADDVAEAADEIAAPADESAEAAVISNDEAVEAEVVAVEAEAPEVILDPIAIASSGMNVRSGPGINYGIVGALQAGEKATVVAKSPDDQWWQVTLATGATGWLFGQLTTIEGSTSAVTVASNIPAPPPPPTALPPTPLPAPTFTYAPPPTAVPVAAAPVPATPVPAPAATQPPAPAPEPEKPVASGSTFKLVERRLWGVQENGGFLAGDSVNCGDKRELRVRVIDAAGNPINGVTVHGVYTKVDVSTGSQGKGDGVAEYVLGKGEDVKVIRDVDGSDVSSDVATGLVTEPALIDTPNLIQAGYCTDEASCQKNVVQPYACGGHYSWDVKFQRNY